MSLRPATPGDARMFFEWRNDPFIVARSTLQKEVSWAEHEAWFTASLASETRLIFVVEREAQPIGQVRLDLTREDAAVISAYLLAPYSGKGLGPPAIREACRAAFGHWPIAKVVACVREDNPSAQSGFRSAGFLADMETLCPDRHAAFTLHLGALVP